MKRHKSLLHRVKDEHWTISMSSRKTPTFVSIITLAFLGRFFILFVPVETGMNILQKNLQNLQHHPNCIPTLPNI